MKPINNRQDAISPLRCDENRGVWKTLLDNMLGFAGVLLLANFSYMLRDGSQTILQFWPVSGLAVGLLLKRGVCILPGLAAGVFVAPLIYGENPLVCVGFAIAGVVEWLLYSYFFGKFLMRTSMIRLLTLPLILIVAAAVSAATAALIGPTTLVLLKGLPIQSLGPMMVDWWHGDFIGIIVVAPLLASFHVKRPSLRDVLSGLVLLGLLVAYGLALIQWPSSTLLLFSYLLLRVLGSTEDKFLYNYLRISEEQISKKRPNFGGQISTTSEAI